ncbi:hypothetical protein P4233_25185 [Pseudomonas aeruginosa]|nr:hypothetical protein [Pseudomonas aeruginosa]
MANNQERQGTGHRRLQRDAPLLEARQVSARLNLPSYQSLHQPEYNLDDRADYETNAWSRRWKNSVSG